MDVGRLDPVAATIATEGGGVIGADEGDVGFRFDGFLETDGPETRVEEDTAVTVVEDVFGGTVGAGEDATFFSGGTFVGASPGTGDGWLVFGVGGVSAHAADDLGHCQDDAVGFGVGEVAAGLNVSVFHAAEDGVLFVLGNEVEAGAALVVLAVVTGPGFAENLAAESEFVVLAFEIGVVFGVGTVRGDSETVRCRAQTHDGAAAFEVGDEGFHLFIGPVLEAGKDDHEVGGVEGVHPGDVVVAEFDGAGLGVRAEEDGAFEAVAFGEDAGEGGKRFLGAVFVVAGDEDDVFADAGAGAALVDDLGLNSFQGEEESEGGKGEGGKGEVGDASVHGRGSSVGCWSGGSGWVGVDLMIASMARGRRHSSDSEGVVGLSNCTKIRGGVKSGEWRGKVDGRRPPLQRPLARRKMIWHPGRVIELVDGVFLERGGRGPGTSNRRHRPTMLIAVPRHQPSEESLFLDPQGVCGDEGSSLTALI